MSGSEALRDRLLREFGVDLPIRGGPGREAAPIVVTAGDLQDAVDVQMQVLRCVGMGSRAAWRLTGQEVITPGRGIVRAVIDTVMVREHGVVTGQEAVYFMLDALPADALTTSLPAPSGFVDPHSRIHLPCQLGWLHLCNTPSKERGDPGVASSVAYDSVAIQGTVDVYDRGGRQVTDDVESAPVIGEFQLAVAGALSATPGAEVKNRAMFRDRSGRGRCLLAIVDLPGDSMSAVLLTLRNGCFVKACMTFDATEREFGRIAHESMEAFVEVVRPGPQ